LAKDKQVEKTGTGLYLPLNKDSSEEHADRKKYRQTVPIFIISA